ncbi:MAG TPA: 3-oxoacyl-ACP reductase FabG [Actinomycetota bacterium]|nr:3-oxoacyl-ACP reductase FabG [Actinomycetota bacterium]
MTIPEQAAALVTGASRGIGAECAKALANKGLPVAIGYLSDKDGALETQAQCPGSIVVNIDVRDSESVSAAFDEVVHELGPVLILVNNAGITRDRVLIRMKLQDWDDVINTDLTGVFRCTHIALPGMLAARWGRVVSTGSIVGSTGNPGQTNYAAAKAGLIGFSKSLAREVGRHGVTVNVVAPGLVETELTLSLSEAAKGEMLKKTSTGRASSPSEVAEAVGFCVESANLTGQVIHVDGGMN